MEVRSKKDIFLPWEEDDGG